jgi:hypothetical protein
MGARYKFDPRALNRPWGNNTSYDFQRKRYKQAKEQGLELDFAHGDILDPESPWLDDPTHKRLRDRFLRAYEQEVTNGLGSTTTTEGT